MKTGRLQAAPFRFLYAAKSRPDGAALDLNGFGRACEAIVLGRVIRARVIGL